MKKNLIALVTLLIIAAVAYTQAGGHEQVSGVIEQVQIMICKDVKNPTTPAKVTVAGSQLIAVKANEAWAEIGDYKGRERKIYKSDGETHTIEDDLRVRSSIKDSEHPRWNSLPDPAANCAVDRGGNSFQNLVPDGQEEILGVLTYKFKDTSGGRKMEMWYAPTLGCAMVKSVVEWETPGNFTEIRPVSIKLGPPAAELFAVDRSLPNVDTLERKARRFVKSTAQKLREEDLDPKQREMLAKFRDNKKVVDYFKKHRLD